MPKRRRSRSKSPRRVSVSSSDSSRSRTPVRRRSKSRRATSRRRSASKRRSTTTNPNVNNYALLLTRSGKEVGRYKGAGAAQAGKKLKNDRFKNKNKITVYLRQTNPGVHKDWVFEVEVSRKEVKASKFMKERTGQTHMFAKTARVVREYAPGSS